MNNIIPRQLCKNKYRFCLLKNKTKNPFETKWQIENNYSYDSIKFIEHIKQEKNYGVVCGFGNLIVIDFDNIEFQNKFLSKFPATFTVKSAGRGLLHLYYEVEENNPESFKILDDNKNTLVDIQATGKQIVAPGSEHENGNFWTIQNDTEIAKISYSEIKAIFYEYIPEEKQVKTLLPVLDNNSALTEKIKTKVSISYLLTDFGIDVLKNPTKCPFHDSKGGKCFSFNETKKVWFCFHCEKHGDIFNLYQEYKSVDFKTALVELAKIANLYDEYEKEIKKITKNRTTSESAAITDLIITEDNVKEYYENVLNFWNQQHFFYDANKIFWLWNEEEKKWDMVDETDMMIALENILEGTGKTINHSLKTNYIEAMRRIGRKNKPLKYPNQAIQFKDKIYDINKNEIFEASSDYFFTNPIPWKIGNSEETKILDEIFTQWVGAQWVPTLYEFLAFSCLPEYTLHRIFCLHGGGSNGKSSFLNIIRKFIGTGNCASSSLDAIASGNRFETCSMYKKLVCEMGETNFSELKRTEILKKLTGQDNIKYEFKNKTPFDEVNYAKIVIATNSLPVTLDRTAGFYRRWLTIEFNNSFTEKIDILKTIPDIEYENLARKCLKIIKDLLEKREFTNEGTIEDRQRRYDAISNPLLTFIKERCVVDPNAKVPFYVFFEELTNYLNKNRKRIISRHELGNQLRDEGYERTKINKRKKDGSMTSWNYILGISLIGYTEDQEEISTSEPIIITNNNNSLENWK